MECFSLVPLERIARNTERERALVYRSNCHWLFWSTLVYSSTISPCTYFSSALHQAGSPSIFVLCLLVNVVFTTPISSEYFFIFYIFSAALVSGGWTSLKKGFVAYRSAAMMAFEALWCTMTMVNGFLRGARVVSCDLACGVCFVCLKCGRGGRLLVMGTGWTVGGLRGVWVEGVWWEGGN